MTYLDRGGGFCFPPVNGDVTGKTESFRVATSLRHPHTPQPVVDTSLRLVWGHRSIVSGRSVTLEPVESRWALVTGASVGLGREFAIQLAEAGYHLVLVARDGEALVEVAETITSRFPVATEVLPANLLDPSDRDRVAARLESEKRPIDVLVNNAGFGLSGQFDSTQWPAEKDHLDIHVTVPLELTHRVLAPMRERGRGRVIVVSSVAAFLSRGTYSAAKRYWVTMARSLTAAYRSDNVSVTALCPGFTRTEFHGRMGMDVSGVPGFLWLGAERVVATGLRDALRGQAVSIPTARYRALAAIAPVVPARFHRLTGEP